MIFLRILIVTFIVAGVLNLLSRKSKTQKESLDTFIIRAPRSFAGLGSTGMALVIGGLVLCEIDNTSIPLSVMLLMTIVLICPSLLLMIAPIKGVWDIIVDGDNITVVKAFIFKRRWKFSDIAYGKMSRGGIKIYVNGRKRKAFFVDGMCDGSDTFLKRMAKEGKEVDYPGGIKVLVEEMEQEGES